MASAWVALRAASVAVSFLGQLGFAEAYAASSSLSVTLTDDVPVGTALFFTTVSNGQGESTHHASVTGAAVTFASVSDDAGNPDWDFIDWNFTARTLVNPGLYPYDCCDLGIWATKTTVALSAGDQITLSWPSSTVDWIAASVIAFSGMWLPVFDLDDMAVAQSDAACTVENFSVDILDTEIVMVGWALIPEVSGTPTWSWTDTSPNWIAADSWAAAGGSSPSTFAPVQLRIYYSTDPVVHGTTVSPEGCWSAGGPFSGDGATVTSLIHQFRQPTGIQLHGRVPVVRG